jgi:outer membrane lipopolysaccharide assembly protein LptE/RlpB
MLQTERNNTAGGSPDHATGGGENNIEKMDKGLKIWHAVLTTIITLVTCCSWIFQLNTQVKVQQTEIDMLKSSDRDKTLQIKDLSQQINEKYNVMNDKLTDVLVILQNKENKK